jgi:hypothetical protein
MRVVRVWQSRYVSAGPEVSRSARASRSPAGFASYDYQNFRIQQELKSSQVVLAVTVKEGSRQVGQISRPAVNEEGVSN